MEPNIWGPSAWRFLHTVTFLYPENPTVADKQNYFIFFKSLKKVLPCPNCQEHYSINFEKFPIRLEKRDDLIEWLIDIHNEVNKMNQKREYSYEEVYDIYNKMYEDGKEKGGNNMNYISILAIISLIAIILYYHKNYYNK